MAYRDLGINTHELIAAADLVCTGLAIFFAQNKNPVQEYELITHLQAQGLLHLCSHDNYWVALFRKHFLVRHCLYQLNERNLLGDTALSIGALTIEPAVRVGTTSLPSNDQSYYALAAYYQDLNHWLNASEENCRSFIDDFWQRLATANNVNNNLLCLGLPATATWVEVQAHYRRLAQTHHPDKGGDSEVFLLIQQAYGELKRVWGK